MPLQILRIPNPMIHKTLLPNLNLLLLPKPIRKSALNKLHRTLHRDSRRRRKQHMKMIGHDNKLMQQVFPLITIIKKHINQKPRPSLLVEDRNSLPSDRSDEERPL